MFKIILKYFFQQIKEIESSKALSLYGACLSFIHIVTFYFWNYFSFFNFTSINHPSSVCLQFFSSCSLMKFPFALFSKIALTAYLVLAIFSVYFFIYKKIRVAYVLLIGLFLFQYFMIMSSANIIGNYYYMPLILSFLYLFVSNKKQVISIMIVLFYAAAGFLKLNNMEWLTGSSLYKISTWNSSFVVFLTFSVIFLEIFISQLLIIKHRLKYIAFLAFVIFHSVSYYWVGYYYPVICLLFLLIFPLNWFLDNTHHNLFDQILEKKQKYSFYFVFGLFIFSQIIPRLYKGDVAVTGEGRIWALTMYDARTACLSYMKVRYKNSTVEFSRNSKKNAVRIRCDPYFYYADAKKACKWAKNNPDFIDVDLHLFTKRKSDFHWSYVVKLQNFCSKKIDYKNFGGNFWINF